MPIPPFSIDGVLPPYVGPSGPGGFSHDMSPYVASAVEIVSTFGTSGKRKKILAHWLDHRADLRAVGLQQGFQWLDGSFVEDKDPNDLDVVTFVFRPPTAADDATFNTFLTTNRHVIDPIQIKARYMLDVFFVDLNAFPESVAGIILCGDRVIEAAPDPLRCRADWLGCRVGAGHSVAHRLDGAVLRSACHRADGRGFGTALIASETGAALSRLAAFKPGITVVIFDFQRGGLHELSS
jgi:hypothetical protein